MRRKGKGRVQCELPLLGKGSRRRDRTEISWKAAKPGAIIHHSVLLPQGTIGTDCGIPSPPHQTRLSLPTPGARGHGHAHTDTRTRTPTPPAPHQGKQAPNTRKHCNFSDTARCHARRKQNKPEEEANPEERPEWEVARTLFLN